MAAGRVPLNALLRGREWKTSNRAVFMRVWDERSFTRGVRVARVGVRGNVLIWSSKRLHTPKLLANYGPPLWAIGYGAHFFTIKGLSLSS